MFVTKVLQKHVYRKRKNSHKDSCQYIFYLKTQFLLLVKNETKCGDGYYTDKEAHECWGLIIVNLFLQTRTTEN